jgi:dTDP-4-amino-4,6-dideoxygalactose transaminase
LTVPFNRPFQAGREQEFFLQALHSGHISAAGHFTEKCERRLEELLQVPQILLTTSCTHALEMTAFLLDIQPGDEVIVPSFTFVSTANAFVSRGARPVFADVRTDTLNLDESRLDSLISPRTKAIVPVHYAGVACALDEITAIAAARGVTVVEDCAHALFGRYRGRQLGRFGRLAAFSFHETKNLSCGEGGALAVNDPGLADQANIIRNKGTNRYQFLHGQVDRYTWVDRGSSYAPSDLNAAVLFAQLEAWEIIQAKRRAIWERYRQELAGWAEEFGIGLPRIPPDCEHPDHLFYLLLPSETIRRRFIAYLAAAGIQAVFHYVPLHSSPMGRRFGARPEDCPVAEDVGRRLVRLPLFTGLSADHQTLVIDAIRRFSPR